MRDGMNRMDGGIPRPFRAGFDADAQAIFGAFTTPPDDTRKGLINAYVLALKAGGVWNSLDGLYVFAAADSQAALINWRNPGTHDATLVNAPTFTQDRGFTGNGTNSYVNSNFNPLPQGGCTSKTPHTSAREASPISGPATTTSASSASPPTTRRRGLSFCPGTPATRCKPTSTARTPRQGRTRTPLISSR